MTEVSHQKCPHCNHNGCYSYNTDSGLYYCHLMRSKGKMKDEWDSLRDMVTDKPVATPSEIC